MKKAAFPIRRILSTSSRNYRNKVTVFLVCAAISFFMWGLIKLSKVYEAPLKYKLTFQNMPSDKILVSAEDTVITLFVRARGLEIYGKLFNSRNNRINIDMSGIRLRRVDNTYRGYIRTSRYLKNIASQLPQDNDLLGVEPDTLRFIFETEYQRKVPVIPDVSLSFVTQFKLYDSLVLKPDSVIIYGVKSILDTIHKITTEHQSYKYLKEDRQIALKLITPGTKPPVSLSNDSVQVEISVERFTESEVEVPIGTDNAEKLRFRTYPDKVTLTCTVAMREYERLDASLFSTTIDYQTAIASGNKLVEVKVVRQPSFVKVIRIEPEKVEFLILK